MLGYGPLAVDGVQGPATWNAIAGFQANNGLAVDGIAGAATLAVLDHQLALRAPPPPAKEGS
jgi:peptidoglycan hydrolase-like protein with peptidoglycan-binding domain